MNAYKNLLYPYILCAIDAETIHHQTLNWLAWAQQTAVSRAALRLLTGPLPNQPVTLFGLTFPNVIGMAAGFDKDVRVAEGLGLLGFGHIEVGTLTPKPQVGNPRPRIFRLPQDEALINRMGFPNGGVAAAVPRLEQLTQQGEKRPFVLGVSLGKQKETPLAEAANDYITVMRAVYRHADYLAINISSPNTPGLRELQGGRYLDYLLGAVQAENGRLARQHNISPRPLLVKIAPDLDWGELDEILTAVFDNQISGIIATNTTISRDGLRDPSPQESGGLSGQPVRQRSTAVIAHIAQQTNNQLPIIGVGGVQTAAHVREKLAAGASLVQLYTGLIYEGPTMIGQILRQLVE